MVVRSLYEIDDKFTNMDFYEPFSTQQECFHIYHNNPSGPDFLLIDIEYGLYSNKSQKALKKVMRKYHLKRIDLPCENSITLPTLEDFYSRIYLIYELFLYYKENPMAISIYSFDIGFNPTPLIIITTKNNFGLLIEFSNLSNQNSFTYNPDTLETKLYLLSIRKNNSLICVITDNNDKLVLSPKKLSLSYNHLIARIRIKYVQNKDFIFKEYYPAFECYLNNNDSIEPVYLIRTESQLDIHLSLIYYDLNNMKKYIFQTFFFNLIIVTTDVIKILPRNVKILFIVKPNKRINICNNNCTTIELLSHSNISYYKISQKIVDISYGVKRCKWIFH